MQHIDYAIIILNDAVEADHDAVLALVNFRMPVNDVLAAHQTIQVGQDSSLGVVGLINGLFGIKDDGCGYITMDCDTEEPAAGRVPTITKIKGFRRV